VIQSEAVIPSAVPARPYLAPGCSRLIDFCVATLVGIMVLPLLSLAIIAIKLVDPGPAFYVQNRQGKDSLPFRFFKLRSMRLHSDVWLRDFYLQHASCVSPADAIAGDPGPYRNGDALHSAPGPCQLHFDRQRKKRHFH